MLLLIIKNKALIVINKEDNFLFENLAIYIRRLSY